jgi:hypothetical protein
MRKIVFLPCRTGWQHMMDFDFGTSHHHTVGEQFHPVPLLLEAGLLEPWPDPLAEALDRLCQSSRNCQVSAKWREPEARLRID